MLGQHLNARFCNIALLSFLVMIIVLKLSMRKKNNRMTNIIIIIINLVRQINSKTKILKHYHLRLSTLLKNLPTTIELLVEIFRLLGHSGRNDDYLLKIFAFIILENLVRNNSVYPAFFFFFNYREIDQIKIFADFRKPTLFNNIRSFSNGYFE